MANTKEKGQTTAVGTVEDAGEDALVIVSKPTLLRLPKYVHLLRAIRDRGRDVVSTSHIATDLNLDPTQVRKDLACTGIAGRPKVGYDINELIRSIEDFLGWNNSEDAFLVGVGALGTALLGHDRLKDYGLRIVAAFDADPGKVGREVHGREILPTSKLPDLAERMHVHIGVLTVPAEGAQTTADLMVSGGIRAIWNFAPTHLEVPDGVVVVDGEIYSTLGLLKHGLARVLREGRRDGV